MAPVNPVRHQQEEGAQVASSRPATEPATPVSSGWVERLRRERGESATSAPPAVRSGPPSAPQSARSTGAGAAADPTQKLARKPGGPAAATAAKAELDKHAEIDYPKYYDPNEMRTRTVVARTSLAALVFFLTCAAWSGWAHRNFNPLGLSSNLWIDLAQRLLPNAWILSVVHNAALAFVASGFFFASTVGHVDPPGDPRRPQTVVWRRQVRRVAFPNWLCAAGLGGVAVALRWHEYPWLALFFEAPASAFALYAAAQRWIPAVRLFISIEVSPSYEGMVNRIAVGGGKKGLRGGLLLVYHTRLVRAERHTLPWEYVRGISGLRLHFIDDDGVRRVFTIRALGSHQLVEWIADYLNGQFKVGRAPGVLPPNFRIFQPTDGAPDPNLFLPPPVVRRVRLFSR